ncbi:cation acetate symporter [Streptomyces sp. NPDC093261]|uniref:sodium/solute symporter n=1 Tax=Streptomyces sp. NPDC093261 TaxID=3366037 RepID=UPI0037FE092E
MSGPSSASPGTTLVVFMVFVALCLLLCVLAGPEKDDPAEFYTGNSGTGALTSFQNGLAIAGDYISAATVLSTTGVIALAGYDGMLVACATVMSLLLTAILLAEPLRNSGRYTMGDAIAGRLTGRRVRIAVGVVTLAVTLPYLTVQLSGAGAMVTFLLGFTGNEAKPLCTVIIGVLMVCYAALGGMRGTAAVQMVKTVVLFATVTVVTCIVLNRFGWNPGRLLDAAVAGSGRGEGYLRPGLEFGDSSTGRLDFLGFQLTIVLGAATMPHVTMRLYGARSARAARVSMRWAVSLTGVFCAAAVVLGLGAAAVVGSATIGASDLNGTTSVLLLSRALGDGSGVLVAAMGCAVFATALAAVTGLLLAAASSVAHDVLTQALLRARVSPKREVVLARGATAVVGALAILLAVWSRDWNLLSLIYLALTLAASVVLPVLVHTLFWNRYTERGMLWCLYGGIAVVTALTLFSPLVSGTPDSLFPHRDFAWFPLRMPGLVTIPLGFVLGWFGSVRHRTGPDARRDEEAELRTLTGVGGE